jgi:hypothetical protein
MLWENARSAWKLIDGGSRRVMEILLENSTLLLDI